MRALVGDNPDSGSRFRFLHAGYATLQRGGRRNPEGQARYSRREEASRGGRLHQSARHLCRCEDQPITKAFGDVTADLLKQMGINVDFVATDWGTVGARRASKSPPGQGGWAVFHTWHAGADCINPAVYNAIRASGAGRFGWPNSPAVEKEVTAWSDAKSLDEEKAAVGRLNKAALEDVIYAPTGFFLTYTAWRKMSRVSSRGRCHSPGTCRRPHDDAVDRHGLVYSASNSRDHPRDGDRGFSGLQSALYRAGRSRRGDCGRSG